MIKFMLSSASGSSFLTLNGSQRPQQLPLRNKNNASFPTTRNVFNWANSRGEISDSSSSLSLTPNFILPAEKRPNLAEVIKTGHNIPIIDLGNTEISTLVSEIARASEEYGLFLILNHGISLDLCDRMLSAVTDFFHLPPQTKSSLVSADSNKAVRISNHFRKVEDQDNMKGRSFSMWSEVFKHPWHPTDDNFASLLPSDPPNYRYVVVDYAKEMGLLMSRLLNLMSRGLGLDGDYIEKRLGNDPLYRVQANFYPPSPKPDLTLGLGVHTDRDALTVLLPSPNVEGLQIMKDGKWFAVDPLPNALVVNVGDQLEILSNGKYKSVVHRVVTNEHQRRVSFAMFYGPDRDALIGPADSLIDEQ